MEKINAAVIGVGSMGKNHARIYSDLPNINLVAVSDSNKEASNNIAAKYNCISYENYQDMIEKENINLVTIAVPTKLHKEIAFDCIEKKINILIEKPIASDEQEAIKIIEFAKKNNVKIMAGHIERFNPAIIELKRRLDNNELGKIFKIDVNRVGPFPKRIRDVGVVIDLGVHDIDIIRYITNSEIKDFHVELEKKIHTKYEDLMSAILRLKNQVICNLNINWLTPTKIRKIYVTGEKGMFIANYLTQELHFYENAGINNNVDYKDPMMGVSEGRMIKFNIEKKEPLLIELQHFVDCVINNTDPKVTNEDSIKAIEIANKLIEK